MSLHIGICISSHWPPSALAWVTRSVTNISIIMAMVTTLRDSSLSQLRTVTGLTYSNPRPGLQSAAAQDTIKWFEARWRRTEHCSSASTVSFLYHVLFTTLFCANICESFPPAGVQLLHYSRSVVIRVRSDKMSLTPALELAIIRVRRG